MQGNKRSSGLKTKLSVSTFQTIVLISVAVLSVAALALPATTRPGLYMLSSGDVSSDDIQSPSTITYTSEVLTEQARQQAAQTVPSVYLPVDTSINRQQLERLQVALSFINSVRDDDYADIAQKVLDLQALETIPISEDLATTIIALTSNQWTSVQTEASNVLQQAMRSSIREDQISSVINNLPSLISLSIPVEQNNVILSLVTPFITPNRLFSEELTEQARQEAMAGVLPVTVTYASGEIIVRRGQIITPAILEALAQSGLLQGENRWKNLGAVVCLVLVTFIFLIFFFNRERVASLEDFRAMGVIALLFILFLYTARLVIPYNAVLPYLFPIPAFALILVSLFNLEIGLIFSIALSILSGFNLSDTFSITLFYLLTSLTGIVILGKGRRIVNFFWAGIGIMLSGSAVILSFRLIDSYSDWTNTITLIGAALFNGFASASLSLLLQYFSSQILGVVTPLQLMDLSRPDHPLLQFLLLNAPGTYQHSLQVSNLAEQAAEAIGADPLLTKVGALYHDAGKAANPSFFIENQPPGTVNPHDTLSPVDSAKIIIRHVTDGVDLAEKYHIPHRLIDFIREHHGNHLTRYQYARALQVANNAVDTINTEPFRYPGPTPRSKETALLMLADGCEARARAERPRDDEELKKVIKKVIDYNQLEGQLDQTPLTLKDLQTVADSFFNTLKNLYHPRIQYPDYSAAEKNITTSGAITEPMKLNTDRTSQKDSNG
jgi:putative nucleotidyltransferase with HDIG domain